MAAPTSPFLAVAGRYALADEIGAGGMATVHLGLARGQGGFARVVAIKRLLPGFARDPDLAAVLMDEARVAGRIHHPNVVSTLDVVAIDDELLLVLEYVHGEPLARLVGKGQGASAEPQRAPPPIAAAVMLDVLHGLHAAHEAKDDEGKLLGVVHRDVTPHNVLVGADGVTRVFDFGIAKAAGRAQHTREGDVKGKLAYMAPEQLRSVTDRTTDVYAAGVCLWEALTGERLFASDNESVVLAKVVAGLVDAPSRRVPDLPKALDEVVLRALARDPAARYATAREMARALEQAMPPASSVEVSAWVESRAGSRLAARAELVARVESRIAALREDEVTLTASDPRAAVTEDEVVAAEAAPPVRVVDRRLVALLGLLALATALVVVAFVVSLQSDGPRAAAATEPPPEPTAAASPSAPTSAELAVSPAPVDVPDPPSAHFHAHPSPPHRRGLSLTSGVDRTGCSPPYSVDVDGVRHYRKECLR